IDPSPIAFEILEKNLNLNSFSQLHLRKIACGAVRGDVRMKWNWHHLQAIPNEEDSVDTVAVSTLPLDQICEEENILPQVLKIDVEGLELPVLQGGECVLKTAKLLFMEVHPPALNELGLSQLAIFDLLTSGGWSGYTLKEAQLTREDFGARTDIFRTLWRK